MPPNPKHLVQVVNLVDLVSCTFDGSAVDLAVGVRDGTDLVAWSGFSLESRFFGACAN